MCVIGIVPNKLDKDTFDRCFDKNKDGFGYAWRSDGKVNFKKGLMKKDEAWAYYNHHCPNSEHIVHFRLGNPVKEELTHPFIISNDSPLVLEYSGKESILFHNGSITSWRDLIIPTFLKVGKVPEGEYSDTRIFSMILSVLGTDIFRFVSTGRFVIMSTNKIITIGDWDKNGKSLWSNDSYKKKETTVTYSYYNQGKYENKKAFEKNFSDLEDCQEFVL